MSDYKERMQVEKAELEERIKKLEIFIDSAAFTRLDQERQKLMKKQLCYMLGYLNTLSQRILLDKSAT